MRDALFGAAKNGWTWRPTLFTAESAGTWPSRFKPEVQRLVNFDEILTRALRVRNPALWWVLAGSFAFLALVVYVPALRELFRFASLHVVDWAVCLVAGMVSVAWFELLKTRRSYLGG